MLKKVVRTASLLVFILCVYSFLGGSKVFEGKFESDYIAWYFLAKGIFCSLALYLLGLILEKLSK